MTAGAANATTVCFDPTSTCTATGEQKIFLEKGTGATGLGNVGSQTDLPLVDFSSTSVLDFKNGFATIKPDSGKSYSNIDVTLPGNTFTDLMFSVQLLKVKKPGFTIDAYDGATLLGTETFSGLKHDADLDFLVVSTTPMTEVDMVGSTGFTETKHFEISGATGVVVIGKMGVTPIPATLPLFAGGLGMFGLIAGH